MDEELANLIILKANTKRLVAMLVEFPQEPKAWSRELNAVIDDLARLNNLVMRKP